MTALNFDEDSVVITEGSGTIGTVAAILAGISKVEPERIEHYVIITQIADVDGKGNSGVCVGSSLVDDENTVAFVAQSMLAFMAGLIQQMDIDTIRESIPDDLSELGG